MTRLSNVVTCFVLAISGMCLAQEEPSGPPGVDGTFEDGAESPRGWNALDTTQCRWLPGDSHSGQRAIYATSRKARPTWVSEPVPIDAASPYVIDGWIKVGAGNGWIETRCLDANKRVLHEWKSPRVDEADTWTYTAIDVPAIEGVASVRIEFWVNGDAALDDVAIRPVRLHGIINGDFEMGVDGEGRFPYWNAEEDNGLLPGVREGRCEFDATDSGEGAGSLKLTASGDWFAFTSIHYPVWAWTDKVTLHTLVLSQADTRLALAWVDSAQDILRVDFGDRRRGAPGWRRAQAGPFAPPENARGVRPVLIVLGKSSSAQHGATALFDDVDIAVTDARHIRVTTNQVGYETSGTKRAMVLTNFFPRRPASARFELLGQNGHVAHGGSLVCQGRMSGEKSADWGWYFWEADFSSVEGNGVYHIQTRVGKEEGQSHPFRIGDDLLFQETAQANVDFFFVQRCGFEVPGWHGACHLDCAKLPDGAHRDLIGGWHSAGDYNKLNWEYGDGGVFYALVNAYESAPQYFQQFDRDNTGLCDIIDEAWWGAKYLAKVQIHETGGIVNHIEQGPDRKTWMKWCPPEEMTDNVVGTEDDPRVVEGAGNSPLACGAWARLSRLLDERGIANDYLDNAERLWRHDTADGTGGPSPLLLLSSVDLYGVTKKEHVLEYARRCVEELLATGQPGGQLNGGYGDSGDIPAAALAYFALQLPEDPLCPRITERLTEHTPGYLAEANNLLGLSMQKPGRDGYFFDPKSTLGCNYMIFARAWSALMVFRVTGDRRLLEYATDQFDFVLGRNPHDLCMMEGEGTVNLPRYHHRYITIPGHKRGAVPGAIPNGFVRDLAGNDRPGVDLSTGGRLYPSYRTNEPWLVHNVFYTLAVTALHESQLTSP